MNCANLNFYFSFFYYTVKIQDTLHIHGFIVKTIYKYFILLKYKRYKWLVNILPRYIFLYHAIFQFKCFILHHILEKKMATNPVLLPEESHGQRSGTGAVHRVAESRIRLCN